MNGKKPPQSWGETKEDDAVSVLLPGWRGQWGRIAAEGRVRYDSRATLRGRLRGMPGVHEQGLWPAQLQAVRNLEVSLREDRPRSLIQMATGSGKTFTSITAIYRLIKFGEAKRVLFLVDRANLGRQTLKEFQQYVTPDDGRVFTDLYNVQHLTSDRVDDVARVCICTIQRLYSMLSGQELDPADEEGSQFDTGAVPIKAPVEIEYNPKYPIETFDVIFTDECHRPIYNLWRQTLEYFDAYLVGLTATPSKQTIGFFNRNLVMEYNHQQAVADGVNVDYDVYRIRTAITEGGSTVEAGVKVDKRDRLTRKIRWEELDEELTYDARKLDRDVVAVDQIRTVVRTFKERLFTEIFPGRSEVPKTLIFAKDDSHADDIVKIVREEFGRGNDFCQKTTYKTTGAKPEDLLASFRNSYDPRIVVTVDMIATGTDIKLLEIVMFLRSVKSRNFFEQMKGRGVRVINDTDFQQVVPDAKSKTRFVIVDCVGVCEAEKTDAPSLERQPTVSFAKLLSAVGFGTIDAAEKAKGLTDSFEAYIAEHRDEITALEVLYSRPYHERLRLKDIRALAETLKAPPRAWTTDTLWRAYETLDQLKVRGSGGRILTDLVALVRYALHQDDELVPFRETVETRFAARIAQQETAGRVFTTEQRRWLEAIRDHVATSLRIEPNDFDYAPFAQDGGLGKVYEVFGEGLYPLLDELNEVLAA